MLTLPLWCSQCEWLLGDRKPSPEELDKGIDPESPLFQAILDNPVVQLGLTNPKTLLGTCLAPRPPHRCPWAIPQPPLQGSGGWARVTAGPRGWGLPGCGSLLCSGSVPALKTSSSR